MQRKNKNMKKKDLIGLRGKTEKELVRLAGKKLVDIAKAKAAIKAGQEKNLKKVKLLRGEISQILTILKEKEIISKLEKEIKEKEKGGIEEKQAA